MWTNLINDKQYIGSAVDLSNRLTKDSSTAYMNNTLKISNSHIYRALLNNGHVKFSLTILEYCEPEQCIERENFYLSSENHEYNILPKAESRLGYKHSDKTKKKSLILKRKLIILVVLKQGINLLRKLNKKYRMLWQERIIIIMVKLSTMRLKKNIGY